MIEDRIAGADWERIASELDARGHAVIERLLTPADCDSLVALYGNDSLFRSRVVMARHGYGRGEYQYFAYPLPDPIARLRYLIEERQAESIEILRSWMEHDEEPA